MRLLLDTCALVALAEREAMLDEAVETIRAAQAAGTIFAPAVIAFEIAQKMAVGKLSLPGAGLPAPGSRPPSGVRASAL
jgi:PIN domain nuclease of toxin-antitoxin system